MHHFHPSHSAFDHAAGQIITDAIAQLRAREQALALARQMILRRDATDDALQAAIETLLTHGDHIDAMRAEMLRAALNRRARAGAAPSHHSEQCSPGTHYDEPRPGA